MRAATACAGAVSLADHAADCHRLMRTVGIERAHVVGHSSSACIALQLALDAPEAVRSLVLADPGAAGGADAGAPRDGPVGGAARARALRLGDKAGAVDVWMRGVCGPGYREPLERALPGAIEQAVADADTFFGQELPAVMQWSFGPADAVRVTQPVLALVGERSIAVFRERRDLLLEWLPARGAVRAPRRDASPSGREPGRDGRRADLDPSPGAYADLTHSPPASEDMNDPLLWLDGDPTDGRRPRPHAPRSEAPTEPLPPTPPLRESIPARQAPLGFAAHSRAGSCRRCSSGAARSRSA